MKKKPFVSKIHAEQNYQPRYSMFVEITNVNKSMVYGNEFMKYKKN